MDNRKIVFRADGSKEIGFGHLVRSAVLAAAYREKGFEPLFITAAGDEAVENFFAARGIPFVITPVSSGIEAARFHLDTMRQSGACATVLDSYALDGGFRRTLKEGRALVIAVDDLYTHYSHADIVINHNPSANIARYGGFAGLKLVGPRYALIDPRLGAVRAAKKPEHPYLLVMLGGTDNLDQMGRVLKALDTVEGDFAITAVGGGYNGSGAALKLRHRNRLLSFTNELPELMASCDAAVSAGGVTCMELAALGKPFMVLVTDRHQADNAAAYEAKGCARRAGNAWELSDGELAAAIASFVAHKEQWPAMGDAGRMLVNPRGVHEVVAATALALASC